MLVLRRVGDGSWEDSRNSSERLIISLRRVFLVLEWMLVSIGLVHTLFRVAVRWLTSLLRSGRSV